jgi:hypothetical protein
VKRINAFNTAVEMGLGSNSQFEQNGCLMKGKQNADLADVVD